MSIEIFRIQSAANAIVLSGSILPVFAEAYMSFMVLTCIVTSPSWLAYISAGFAMSIVVLLGYAVLLIRKAQKYQAPKVELSHFALYQGEYEHDAQQGAPEGRGVGKSASRP
ncbi:hypothetical protein [Alteromonas sp. ASW11-130]|uniref:hypothetical protein n=1 Tax=Alteromonas sp. ASW11-130 TaxID=3015775 RepID=UPI0022429D72|nr:hypothetical protein [Alteromonas sp. ASW11-130]MCW8092132.1 hypothetical protein [Alteromonas sp. ASW11-130]